MASPTPTLESKYKSRLPQYSPMRASPVPQNRDRPMFTEMRRPQFQTEFTTESLNNTGIASPSPARGFGQASKLPERNGRNGGLGAAFRRVDEQNRNEDNAAGNPRRTYGNTNRPAFSREYQSELSKPTPKLVPPRSSTRTPSPDRGRPLDALTSPASAVSESSPPREFAEAYKQIDEAENLADQDEADISDESSEALGNGLHPDRESSRRSSRRRSPGEDDAVILDTPSFKRKEDTQESVPSLPSDLEISGNVTNKSSPSRYQRDLKRLDEALGRTEAFSKAKRKPARVGVDDLRRDNASPRRDSRSEHSNTSGSNLSEGSYNVPANWGRKAREGRTWVSSLARNAKSDENVRSGSDLKAQAIQDWQAEASVTPLPQALENDFLEYSPSPAPSKPSSGAARDRVRKFAFGELGSLEDLQHRTKNPANDIMRDREMQNLAKSAVTTNRLGELKEQRSLERVRGRSTSLQSEDEPKASKSAEDLKSLKPRPSQTALQPVTEESAGSRAKSDSRPAERKKDTTSGVDTRDVLRELSKVASPSSSPDSTAGRDTFETNVARNTEKAPEIEPINIVTPAPTKPQTYLKTPRVTGAWIDTPLPTTKVERITPEIKAEEDKESVRQTLKKLDLEQLIDDSVILRDAEAEKQSLEETAPRLPASALAAIIERAKDKKAKGIANHGEDTLLLDDSTILSLEGFLANTEKPGNEPEFDAGAVESDDSDDAAAQKQSDTQRQTHRKPKSFEQDSDSDSDAEIPMTTRLGRLKTSIHDAKLGVGSLQKRINNLHSKPASRASSRASSTSRHSECHEAGELHDFIFPCEKCGHKTGSSLWTADDGSILEWEWRPLQVLVPQLWYWPMGSRVPRATKLGWALLMLSILGVAEWVLSDLYSPPFYADSMTGFGVDLDAPRPPFVLPKLFWKHVLASPMQTLTFLWQMFVQFMMVIGLSARRNAADEASAASNVRYTYRPAMGQDHVMGMDADEIL